MPSNTPNRCIRVPDALWAAAKAAALSEYRTITDVVIESLVTLVRRHNRKGAN